MLNTQHDVSAGLVVHLDTTVLRSLGGCQTNAVTGPAGDRAVVGAHDFLVVHVDGASGVCTAVPLFPKSAVGNEPLVDRLKSGTGDEWIGTDTYFSHWQHWRIPMATLVAACDTDERASASPRRYAEQDRSALDDIRVWESRNRAPYRPA